MVLRKMVHQCTNTVHAGVDRRRRRHELQRRTQSGSNQPCNPNFEGCISHLREEAPDFRQRNDNTQPLADREKLSSSWFGSVRREPIRGCHSLERCCSTPPTVFAFTALPDAILPGSRWGNPAWTACLKCGRPAERISQTDARR